MKKNIASIVLCAFSLMAVASSAFGYELNTYPVQPSPGASDFLVSIRTNGTSFTTQLVPVPSLPGGTNGGGTNIYNITGSTNFSLINWPLSYPGHMEIFGASLAYWGVVNQFYSSSNVTVSTTSGSTSVTFPFSLSSAYVGLSIQLTNGQTQFQITNYSGTTAYVSPVIPVTLSSFTASIGLAYSPTANPPTTNNALWNWPSWLQYDYFSGNPNFVGGYFDPYFSGGTGIWNGFNSQDQLAGANTSVIQPDSHLAYFTNLVQQAGQFYHVTILWVGCTSGNDFDNGNYTVAQEIQGISNMVQAVHSGAYQKIALFTIYQDHGKTGEIVNGLTYDQWRSQVNAFMRTNTTVAPDYLIDMDAAFPDWPTPYLQDGLVHPNSIGGNAIAKLVMQSLALPPFCASTPISPAITSVYNNGTNVPTPNGILFLPSSGGGGTTYITNTQPLQTYVAYETNDESFGTNGQMYYYGNITNKSAYMTVSVPPGFYQLGISLLFTNATSNGAGFKFTDSGTWDHLIGCSQVAFPFSAGAFNAPAGNMITDSGAGWDHVSASMSGNGLPQLYAYGSYTVNFTTTNTVGIYISDANNNTSTNTCKAGSCFWFTRLR